MRNAGTGQCIEKLPQYSRGGEREFRPQAGEVLGYLGPNGSGKSTTVKMVMGMIRPTKGKVLFAGRNIHDDLTSYRVQLGYVPEEAQVYTHLSGLEYLQLVGRLRGIEERLIEYKARTLLQLLSLEAAQYSALSDYSKGMKQRVLIAAALLHDPQLLVFDEPLSGLDAISARLFKDLLILLSGEGKAILYISHVLEVVERVCSRVIVLAKGQGGRGCSAGGPDPVDGAADAGECLRGTGAADEYRAGRAGSDGCHEGAPCLRSKA